jgi:hypothetical protein
MSRIIVRLTGIIIVLTAIPTEVAVYKVPVLVKIDKEQYQIRKI